ncbi:MAG: ATP-grasp domain-containing protein [Thiogranum sp.]|jgi:predicted ATP-grasp superfamily ATP-dependent carboligase|nr:ATP-grasp domain-containing protein [Thiogranum sp.]
MRIFIVEYITGGGLADSEPDAGLLRDAEVMLQALLGDLLERAGVDLLVSRDARLPALPDKCAVYMPRAGGDIWLQWTDCIRQCDAVWPIMPESGGLLERISELVLACDRRLVGCSPAAVAITASKHRTLELLGQAGIAVVPTYRADGEIPRLSGPWVLKPDDGVGCEGIRLFSNHETLCHELRFRQRHAGWIAQPYLKGESASLSLICNKGNAHLLSVNLQQVVQARGGLKLEGVQVNAKPPGGSGCTGLAKTIAAAIPGLWGYVGVDILLTAQGAVVLEINPRLTVSYAGLYSALGLNPAEMILRLLRDGELPTGTYAGSCGVNIALEVACVA